MKPTTMLLVAITGALIDEIMIYFLSVGIFYLIQIPNISIYIGGLIVMGIFKTIFSFFRKIKEFLKELDESFNNSYFDKITKGT